MRSYWGTGIALAFLLSTSTALAADPDTSSSTIPKTRERAPTRAQLLRLAEAQLDTGRPADAATTASLVLDDPPTQAEGQAEINAWQRSREIFVQARDRVAHLTVKVTGGINVTIEIDGTVIAREPRGLYVNPGEHVVLARAEGYETAVATVRLTSTETRGISLTMVRKNGEPIPGVPDVREASAAAPPAMEQPASAAAPPAADDPIPPERIAMWSALGTGALGLTVGAIAGIVSMNKASDIRAQCVNNTCAPSARDDIESGKTWGNVSTVGLVVGAIGLTTAGVLYLISPSSPSKKTVAFGGPTGILSGRF
jgi:hypothetical protein